MRAEAQCQRPEPTFCVTGTLWILKDWKRVLAKCYGTLGCSSSCTEPAQLELRSRARPASAPEAALGIGLKGTGQPTS